METVSDLLRNADPLRHEPSRPEEERERIRRAVLAAASEVTPGSPLRSRTVRTPVGLLAAVALMVVGIAAVGSSIWSRESAAVHAAAVQFEVRLAETAFSPGLREARIAGSGEVVYLHHEIIMTNDDIAESQIIDGDTPSRFGVAVVFKPAAAERVRQTTARHVGELIAILIDGEVVTAPRLRSPISTLAVISGDYTRAEAERIADGMRIR
jgi:hypothetical protein